MIVLIFILLFQDIKLLHTPHNNISMALALTNYEIQPYLEKRKEDQEKEGEEEKKEEEEEEEKKRKEEAKKKEGELSKDITLLGSMLFSRQCSGFLNFLKKKKLQLKLI